MEATQELHAEDGEADDAAAEPVATVLALLSPMLGMVALQPANVSTEMSAKVCLSKASLPQK